MQGMERSTRTRKVIKEGGIHGTVNYLRQWPRDVNHRPPMIKEIIADIKSLYPECKTISVGGSYARGEPKPYSDLDIIIDFPKMDGWLLVIREDSLWEKWNKETTGKTIDFIIHTYGGPFPGVHSYRKKKKLRTPKVIVYRQATRQSCHNQVRYGRR